MMIIKNSKYTNNIKNNKTLTAYDRQPEIKLQFNNRS